MKLVICFLSLGKTTCSYRNDTVSIPNQPFSTSKEVTKRNILKNRTSNKNLVLNYYRSLY